jgi:adenylate cyclase, class 2
MKNIEIKAKCVDLDALRKRIKNAGGRYVATMKQVDTYFNVPKGRMKLREIDDKESMLVYYERPDQLSSKESNYFIYPSADGKTLKETLAMSLGVNIVVKKVRELYMIGYTRVHLDEVYTLGQFMELETVITTQTENEARQENLDIIDKLQIRPSDMIKNSYSDMLEKGRF